MILSVKEDIVNNNKKNYQFELEYYQIRIYHLTKYYSYSIVNHLTNERYSFFIEDSPENVILSQFPLSLYSQKAMQDLCEQISFMNDFYPIIQKRLSSKSLSNFYKLISLGQYVYKKNPDNILNRSLHNYLKTRFH